VRSKIEDEFDLALFPALLVLLEFLNRNAPVRFVTSRRKTAKANDRVTIEKQGSRLAGQKQD
jgi:hypothetical protein